MSDTPKTTAAMASFNEQCDQPVAASEMAELERENAELREALKPFADYAKKHGATNLVGRNAALITGDDWRAAVATYGLSP